MNAYATWTIDDNGGYRGIVVSSKTYATTMRTAHTYSTPEAATLAARGLIEGQVSA